VFRALTDTGVGYMIFERFEEQGLSQFSYLIGDESSRAAAVVDPVRDVDRYVNWIENANLELSAILETHIHADYASGSRELADITDTPYYASAYDKNEKYEMQFPHVELEDGDTVDVGNLTFRALHTPGHTPEHLSYLMYGTHSDEPEKLFSGDFIFVGSLGRPDLIGDQQKEPLARTLFGSVRKIKSMDLPGNLRIHPAHGSGSMCGAGLSDKPESTLGEERSKNPYFRLNDEDEFVEAILESLGDFPPYYKHMKDTNSKGAHFIQPIEPPRRIPIDEFFQRVQSEDNPIILDLRDQVSFGHEHIPESINLPYSPNINRFGPWVLSYDQPILLVGDVSMGPKTMEDVYRQLVRVELDNVEGYLQGGYESWSQDGRPTDEIQQLNARQLREQLQARSNLRVIDVRSKDEYRSGHIPGSRWIPFGQLQQRHQRGLRRRRGCHPRHGTRDLYYRRL